LVFLRLAVHDDHTTYNTLHILQVPVQATTRPIIPKLPTNGCDNTSRDEGRYCIAEYPGTAVLVTSHHAN